MTRTNPTDGVLLLNFGEPAVPDEAEVTAYLERIFLANAVIEDPRSEEAARQRSGALAARRAPALLEEYRRIGGSPLHEQAMAQTDALRDALAKRGSPAVARCAMQYTRPTMEEGLGELRDEGVTRAVLLPIYPLCGPSTTVAALAEARAAAARLGWEVDLREVTGWHRHPAYIDLRVEAIAAAARHAGLDPRDDAVEVVFSAHGTPMKYVREGSRYVRYVEDWCSLIAARLGLERYTLGYQNHSNRGVEWTRPDVEEAIRTVADRREAIIVDAVSFMHEQSETLAELDLDLRAEAEALGLEMVRVPVPHGDAAFAAVLADLVDAAFGRAVPGIPDLQTCVCRSGADVCLNGAAVG